MKRKIVDLVQDIEADALEAFHLTEMEISDLSQGADLEKIRRMAFAKVGITDQGSGSHATVEAACGAAPDQACGLLEVCGLPEKKYRRKRRGFWIASAVAAALCLSGTAFAIHQWYMEDFFGEGAVPAERLDRVLESQVSGGVRMTLAEVIAGEQDANIIVYFERTDGKPFAVSTQAADLRFQLSTAFEGQQALNSASVRMLDENHKLAYCYSMSAFESILGETLSIGAAYLFENKFHNGVVDVDLSEQFSAHPIRLKSEESDPFHNRREIGAFEEQAPVQRAAAEPVAMPLEKEYPKLQFAGVAFIDRKLAIATYGETGGSGADAREASISRFRNTVHIAELKDRRTGKVYRTNGYSSIGGADRELDLEVSYFEGFTEGDLPYLIPIAEYSLPQMVSDGSWSFTYTFEREEIWKSADTDLIIDTARERLRITRVSASTMGILLQGEWMDRKGSDKNPRPFDVDVNLSVKAVMKDGSIKQMGRSGGATHWKGVHYKALYGESPEGKDIWERKFLTDELIKNMKAVVIDGTTVPLHKENEEE